MLGLGLGLNKNTFQRNIVRDGLVLYLDGKDFSNSPPTATWRDRSGLGNNATPSGMAYTTASGSDGVGGIIFDGVDDKYSIDATNIVLNGVQTYDINFTAKVKNIAQYILSYPASNGLGNRIYLRIEATGNLVCVFGDNTSLTIKLNAEWNSDTNYNVVLIRDSISKKVSVYFNGVKVINSATVNIDNTSTTTTLYIGTIASTNFFNGIVRNLKIYNRALNDIEILKNYNASK